jgi:hypothetical protein
MTKKILKISAFVLIILAVALTAYYFILSTNENVATGKKPFFGNLFPFGNNTVVNEEIPFASTTPEIKNEPQTGTFEQKVRLISNEPVAGSIFIPSTKGDTVRYIEKATGHIFDVPTFENTTNRISNTTIPQIYIASFTENGNSFIAQYTKDGDIIETFYGKITGTSTERTVSGTILSRSTLSFSTSPDQKNIFVLEKTKGGTEGYIQNLANMSKKLVWTSPLREFIPQFISTDHITLQSKPHTSANGLLFDINIQNNTTKLLLTQLNLSTLSNKNGISVLYSNNKSLFVFNVETKKSVEINPRTFPEKCVWANTKAFLYCAVPKTNLNSTSLYSWYQGKVSYSDTIWEYDLVGDTARQIVNLEELAGRSIDISNISINQSDTLLLIQSKTDGSLWTVKTN